jgi:hypothetical protein
VKEYQFGIHMGKTNGQRHWSSQGTKYVRPACGVFCLASRTWQVFLTVVVVAPRVLFSCTIAIG